MGKHDDFWGVWQENPANAPRKSVFVVYYGYQAAQRPTGPGGAMPSAARIKERGDEIPMAWYDHAVFYHIYPLGLCGCAHENDGQPTPGAFRKLDQWAAHAASLGCTALYIGPLFESGSHGYDTVDYRRVDRRLGTNEEFRDFVAGCHARGQKVIVDGVFNHVGRGFFAFQELLQHREQG